MTLRDLDEIPRDQWGRPLLILPQDTGTRTAFTRASTLSTAIENTFGLEQWRQRQIILGLLREPGLLEMAKEADNKGLNRIADAAMLAMEADKAASLGTHIHEMTALADSGLPLARDTKPEIIKIVNDYLELRNKWKVLAIERFIGCIQIRTAGTYDRLLQGPDGNLYIADIKTGIDAPKYSHTAQVQMAVYAHGTEYEYPGDTWAAKSLADIGVSQQWAVLIHLPQDGGKQSMHWVNIEQGWKYAMVSSKVREWWKTKPTKPITGYH